MKLLYPPVHRVFGILNGTCNYILTRMEQEGLSFEDCLKDAQRLGYAEADPTFDIEGVDAGHKISILAAIAFGIPLSFEKAHVEGARNIPHAQFREAVGSLNPDDTIVTYCNKGVTGNATQNILLNRRFRHAYNLSGGMNQYAIVKRNRKR